MIDVLKNNPNAADAPSQSTKTGINMLLALALAWVVYDTAYWTKLIPITPIVFQESSQVLFVVTDNMSPGQGQVAISQKVDRYCEENGIERRRLEVGQDVSGAEPWLKPMADIGYGQAPCIVFRSSAGKIDCVPIPESIDEVLSMIGERIR